VTTFRRNARALGTAIHYMILETTRELGIILGFTILLPIGILFFLNVLVAPAMHTQVLVGVIMLEMALLNINALAQSIGFEKQTKMLDLWVSLPVSPVVYVLGNALSLLPFTLLSAAVTLTVAVVGFGFVLPLAILPLLVVGMLLIWASTLGIGFLIGVYGRTPRQINMWAQIIGVLLSFFAPVFYPLSVLPVPLQVVASAWPLTWGASFLLGILHSNAHAVLVGGGVLVGFVALWFVLIAYGLRWRQK
jgi:ABC-2 type transport system permease protein